MNVYVTDEHLGGYVVGGDEATYYPDLWRWLVDVHKIRTVLDVGCGEGHALSFFRDLGCEVIGIDGIKQDDPDIRQHDFTTGLWYDRSLWESDPFDLVWCCEFVEHVEEQYMRNFLQAFRRGRMVMMTHAAPGQDGYHHVNCQPDAYWGGALAAVGFQLDMDMTVKSRKFAALNTSPWNHYVRSGMVFRRVWS